MHSNLEPILNNLSKAQAGLLSVADSVSSEQWKTSPGNGAWSTAELVAHLITVERTIIAAADRIVQKPESCSVVEEIPSADGPRRGAFD